MFFIEGYTLVTVCIMVFRTKKSPSKLKNLVDENCCDKSVGQITEDLIQKVMFFFQVEASRVIFTDGLQS